mmetsp:Transcript_35362/g.65847  ORF Transcript_35362/g.65847 Transcript_35362/m.65847 type:complete len:203 (-) Transcript_35362:496-1104(-)
MHSRIAYHCNIFSIPFGFHMGGRFKPGNRLGCCRRWLSDTQNERVQCSLYSASNALFDALLGSSGGKLCTNYFRRVQGGISSCSNAKPEFDFADCFHYLAHRGNSRSGSFAGLRDGLHHLQTAPGHAIQSSSVHRQGCGSIFDVVGDLPLRLRAWQQHEGQADFATLFWMWFLVPTRTHGHCDRFDLRYVLRNAWIAYTSSG